MAKVAGVRAASLSTEVDAISRRRGSVSSSKVLRCRLGEVLSCTVEVTFWAASILARWVSSGEEDGTGRIGHDKRNSEWLRELRAQYRLYKHEKGHISFLIICNLALLGGKMVLRRSAHLVSIPYTPGEHNSTKFVLN